jgi:D-alanyl-D-alanine carboxypeptidase
MPFPLRRGPAAPPPAPRPLAFLAALLAAALLALPGGPAEARIPAEIVVDARTGEVLHADGADARTHPASLAKMMTLYLAFEALESGRLRLDRRLPVSRLAASQAPTRLGLKAGGRITVEHAILGLITRSANDAAVVLAEALGGGVEGFARRMNAKARDLGMKATVFRNPSGLPDPAQVTTARDMARLARALIRDFPRRYPYFSRTGFSMEGRSFRSHNRLLSRYPGMDGLKTGYIRASGFNLAASAVRGKRRLVAVVMGGASPALRDDRMAEILDRAFERAPAPEARERPRVRPPAIPQDKPKATRVVFGPG